MTAEGKPQIKPSNCDGMRATQWWSDYWEPNERRAAEAHWYGWVIFWTVLIGAVMVALATL